MKAWFSYNQMMYSYYLVLCLVDWSPITPQGELPVWRLIKWKYFSFWCLVLNLVVWYNECLPNPALSGTLVHSTFALTVTNALMFWTAYIVDQVLLLPSKTTSSTFVLTTCIYIVPLLTLHKLMLNRHQRLLATSCLTSSFILAYALWTYTHGTNVYFERFDSWRKLQVVLLALCVNLAVSTLTKYTYEKIRLQVTQVTPSVSATTIVAGYDDRLRMKKLKRGNSQLRIIKNSTDED